jgi:hypothetical protein
VDQKNGKKLNTLFEDARKIQGCFRLNTREDVTAICTNHCFEDALNQYGDKVDSGVIPKCEKVTLFVHPTYTFAGSIQTMRPIHTADITYLEGILHRILEKIANASVDFDCTKPEDRENFDRLGKIIFRRDSRLYVPFAGDHYNQLWSFYEPTDYDEAVDFLLNSVPAFRC